MNSKEDLPFDHQRPYANSAQASNTKQIPARQPSRQSQQERAETPDLNATHSSNKPMELQRTLHRIEHEDDTGRIQQVSGGFGDSNTMDQETMRILRENQARVDAILAQLVPISQEQWENQSVAEEHAMESGTFDFEEIKQRDTFGIKMFKDSCYKGELLNNKRNGAGVMIYRKCRLYEGYWQGDNRHGKGMERYSNGNRYEGDFKANKPHGKGVYTWVNGEVYEGEWANGLKQGQGIWKGIFGDSYIGEWKESKADGYGVHQWKNGDRYEGAWKDCLKHGQGSDIFAMGDVYTGQYEHGKPHGFG